MLPFILIVLLSTIADAANNEAPWNYGDLGPNIWSDSYPLCAGQSQSPVNIRTACTKYRPLPPFQFSPAFNAINNFTLLNNGHTVTGTYKGNNPSFKLTGGGLFGTFEFINFHLHWGQNRKTGSEHQVNGDQYAGEIHFVFKNSQSRQTAVLAFFMNSTRDKDIGKTSDSYKNSAIEEWRKYFTVAGGLRNKDDSVVFRTNLALLMGNQLTDFWRYQGSLTAPPCTEDIIWTVFKTPILFTEVQLDRFRKNIMFEDYRGPQPLFNRVVHRSFTNEIVSKIPDYNVCLKKF